MEPENDGLEDSFPDFNWVIFRFHVNLPGCIKVEHEIYILWAYRRGELSLTLLLGKQVLTANGSC